MSAQHVRRGRLAKQNRIDRAQERAENPRPSGHPLGMKERLKAGEITHDDAILEIHMKWPEIEYPSQFLHWVRNFKPVAKNAPKRKKRK